MSLEFVTVRRICHAYDLSDSTVRDWIEYGVFGEIECEEIKGRKTTVFNESQIERLELFLLLYKDFKLELMACIKILDDIEDPDNKEGAIELLTSLQLELTNKMEKLENYIDVFQ